MASQPTPEAFDFVHDIQRLDQHFVDAMTADHVVAAATIRPSDTVLDIGAGTGILTAAILTCSPRWVIAIEADERCQPHLERLRQDHPNLTIKLDRIQNVPSSDLAAATVIIANPPFSALDHLTRLVRELPRLRQAILCVGRRWADAATARTTADGYGVPSIAIQSRFNATTIGQIDGGLFTPAIRRPAALLELTRRDAPDPGLDLLADAVLTEAGSRLKDFLRSRRLRRRLGAVRHQELLHTSTLRRLQQRRLRDLTNQDLSLIAQLLTSQK